tara:strand:+ start:816 stop:983 length:168 start_codon:yes stop_codon:yes gene_type:complete
MITNVKKIQIEGSLISYGVTLDNGIKISVPKDEANTDYQEILKWVEDGNTIEEAD